MFRKVKTNVEHSDVYADVKLVSNELPDVTERHTQYDDADDPLLKFKKNFHLTNEYEKYLFTEKKMHENYINTHKDPFEEVASKIRRGERLSAADKE